MTMAQHQYSAAKIVAFGKLLYSAFQSMLPRMAQARIGERPLRKGMLTSVSGTVFLRNIARLA